MKSYLFVYSATISPDQVHIALNHTNAVKTWIAPFPNSAILISDLNIQDLTAVIKDRINERTFIVTEIGVFSTDGWLPQKLWTYVNEPQKAVTQNIIDQLLAAAPKEVKS